ncbi:hypothetical protein NK6_7776 [Bradyrhizobium diazoefficiens]|uniref:Uncharacterized protein n=1 Tax=Bradyrhizobium diazoefficiens TaxID=1355477 RepID=A0A0E4BU47_9BRAD|nr:hypothetical protein NK6_7776 [Bradyrhizobium diazoefficiens]
MQLVFRVEMPTDRVEWVAVRPRLERFAAPYLDNFQVRFHIRSLRAGAVFDDPPLSPYRLNCSALPLIRDRSDRYPGPPPRFQCATDTFLMCSTRPRNRGPHSPRNGAPHARRCAQQVTIARKASGD